VKVSRVGKHVLVGISTVALIGFSIIAWREYKSQETQEITENVLSYTITPMLNNRINLIDNILYDEIWLSDEQLIINRLIEDISADYRVEIEADKGSEIDAVIDHYLLLEGIYGNEEMLLYTRVDPIYTKIINGGERIWFREKQSYDLNEYKVFLLDVYNNIEINASNKLKAVWNITGTITKDGESLPIEKTMHLLIPIDYEVMQLEKIGFEPTSESLTTTNLVVLPKDYTYYYYYLSFAIVALIVLVMILIFAKVPKKSNYQMNCERIFKIYGERLARLYVPMTNDFANLVYVSGVEDLMKISDEIRQPVFYYKIDEMEEKKIEYYVFDETRIYYFVMFEEMDNTIDSFVEKNSK